MAEQAVNLEQLALDQTLDEIPDPVVIPGGHYRGVVQAEYKVVKNFEPPVPFIRYFVVLSSPEGDVNENELTTALEEPTKKGQAAKTLQDLGQFRFDLSMDPSSEFAQANFKKFSEKFGATGSTSKRQALSLPIGKDVVVEVQRMVTKDNSSWFNPRFVKTMIPAN
jgi:hypothetical protein